MSERLMIAAAPRTLIGKQVRQLRRNGYIPAVIYGQGEPEHIQLENLSLRRVLRHASTTHLINLDMTGNVRTVLAREIQVHLTRGDLIHVDFYEVNMSETITSTAELIMTGKSAPAIRGGGTDVLLLHDVEIECLPDNLVSEIFVDMSRITRAEDALYLKDIPAPEGVTILTDPEMLVARFEYEAVGAGTDEEEEDMTSPGAVEVITKGKEEDEE